MENWIILTSVFSCFCLLALHFMSPEFNPAWRMVSEYALGKNKWLLTLFFISWGLSTLMLPVLLWNEVHSIWFSIGLILTGISGIGALMGGLFDVKHKLHGLAFGLGIPTLPIGALIVSYHLISLEKWQPHQNMILISTHSIWISVLLMAVSMALLMSGYKKSGLPMGPGVEPPEKLPAGVIGINGYFNRVLIFVYIAWVIIISSLM